MKEQVVIGYEGGHVTIACPFWANELVQNHVPNRRWSKAKRYWYAPLLRTTVEGVHRLRAMEGVEVTDSMLNAMEDYEKTAIIKTAAPGKFPSWYPFKSKLKRLDGTGTDEYRPYAHALKVLDKKWGKHAFALHHDMGTAKTRTLIDFSCALRMEGKINALLVMVKLSGRRNWLEQLNGPMSIGGIEYGEGWAPIPVDVHLPTTDERKEFFRWLRRPHDFKALVVGLESLSQGRMHEMVEEFLRLSVKVHGVVDESHLIANYKSIRSQRVYSFRPHVAYRDNSTGTPIKQDPLDTYGQFEWLDPEIIGIGDWYAFRNRYAVVIEQKTKAGKRFPLIVGYQNIDELTKTLAPFSDEVRKKDVLDLPPKNYLPHLYVQPTAQQAALYKKIKDEGAYTLSKTKGEQVIKNALELELRLHQIAQGFMPEYTETPYIGRAGDDRIRRDATWHPTVPIERNPKLIELVDLCRFDRQFIIWVSYRSALEAVVRLLTETYPKQSICQIHGGVSEDDRALFRRQYQKGQHKFMVGNTATGGTADTWTACETMVYLDNSNRMVDRLQSEDRAHRGGLTHPVDYVDIVMEGTVDVARMKAIEQKIDLAEYFRRNLKNIAQLLSGGSGA